MSRRPPPIRSRHNPRVRWLREVVRERPPGLAWVEGVRLCEEVLRSPARLHTLAHSPRVARGARGAALLRELERRAPATLHLSDEVFDYVADTRTAQGIGAVVHLPEWGPEEERFCGQLSLFLAGVQDPGNVGTLVRTAEGFALGPLMVAGATADPYSPKAIRASMGSALRWPVIRIRDAAAFLARAKLRGVRIIAADPHAAALELPDCDLRQAGLVLIGGESAGVGAELEALADLSVRIPMAGETESFNAAVAGSIVLYEAFRQRRRAGARG